MARCLLVLGGLSLILSFSLSAQPAPIKAVAPSEVKKLLQVPSPDWRDQVIYFVMTDRFDDGNPANSNQKAGEYDPADGAKYSGGDLAGVTRRLNYIKGLGATAVWVTPPVANQWWDPRVTYGGYHGYWAENFVQVDKHLGTLQDYQTLSATLHKNGMYLVQDIVPNHTGNFFHFEGPAQPTDPAKGFSLNPGSVPVSKPTQKPFDRNDFTSAGDREADVYHWTPNIGGSATADEVLNNQLADLDDLNTENPVVVDALKDSFGYWIKEAGVDAFRIDTVRYVPHPFWNEFLWSTDKKHPGIVPLAKSLGKKNFFTFGEDWESNAPYVEKADWTQSDYLGPEEARELSSVLNFPLQADLKDVFARGKATDELTFRLKSQAKNYPDPSLLVNFIDNHDMARFGADASPAALKQALLFLFTVPGVPVVYYGTEQNFTETRASMFAQGWGSGGTDRFDTQSEGYRFLKSLAALRASERELSHGTVKVLKDSTGAGIFAYTVTWKGRTALVAFNTSDHPMLLDNAATGLKAGLVLKTQASLGESQPALTVGAGGTVSAVVGPRGAGVWSVVAGPSDSVAPASGPAGISSPTVSGIPTYGAPVTVGGTLPQGVSGARLVVGGNLDTAVPLTPDAQGAWTASLPVDTLDNGRYAAVVQGRYADGRLFVSAPWIFQVELAFTTKVVWDDPVGDDHGPAGNYRYPTNATFTSQNDLQKVELATAGSSLKVTITLVAPISTVWGPLNGFDHVTFYLYLQVPGQSGGATVLPLQNSPAPSGLDWTRVAFVGGWNNQLSSAAGAGPKQFGATVTPSAKVAVDKERRTVTLTFGGESLGFPSTLSGTKVYLTTWDFDGMGNSNRSLVPEGAEYNYGGPADGPKIMDDTPVLVLP